MPMPDVRNTSIQEESTSRAGATLQLRADTFLAASHVFPPQVQQIGAQRTYLDEKQTFLSMLPTLRWRYPGEYVAISGGHVVTHGPSRREVTRQYFSQRAHGPVCIGFTGQRRAIRQMSPFLARPRSDARLP